MLYPRLIGDAWSQLSEPLRRIHSTGALKCCVGSFSVQHGTMLPTRLLIRFLGLPAAGENISTRLVVTPLVNGERWDRTFARKSFRTEQREHAGQLLAERIGAMEILFRLAVINGALCYQQTRAVLCVGRLRVPLPRWLSPQITAREWALQDESRVHVSVSVQAPLTGLLISYRGFIDMEEVQA